MVDLRSLLIPLCALSLITGVGLGLRVHHHGRLSMTSLQPEQIHLSATGTVTEMVVTWSTFNDTQSLVQYGTQDLNFQAEGSSTKFVDGGWLRHTQYIHRVKLTDLTPGAKYIYRCGGGGSWSLLFFFRAHQNGTKWSPRLAIYGDMGNENAVSLDRLQKGAQGGEFDAIIHAGDFAYDFDEDNGKVGDKFMRQIQPVAAYVPYMATVGNHEIAYNFSHYKNRFTMPSFDGNQNLWYSWNIGSAHFVLFSTEVYFFHAVSKETKANQLKWLQADLQEANKPENRAAHPWIITVGHRPMYCSGDILNDCAKRTSIVRTELEDLFYENGVDLEIWAHEHNYERLWPVYREKVYNGSKSAPYTNPKAPVHLITGSAGCKEHKTPFEEHPKPWDAFRADVYGFSILHIVNQTHLNWEQISDKTGDSIDRITLIKDKHGKDAWM